MAIRPEDTYPGQTVAASAAYPHGSAQNITAPGDGLGTPWEKTLLNDLWGFLQALLAEDSIAPSGSPDTALVSQYLDGVKAAAVNALYTPLVGPAISISGYLDRNGVWAEDEAAIQDAADYLVTAVRRDTINLPPNASIPITTGLTINPNFVSFDGHGAELDASGMAAGIALSIAAAATPGTEVAPALVRNLSLRGPGKVLPVIGIGFSGAGGPALLRLAEVTVNGFYIGELRGGGAYTVEAAGCVLIDCATGVSVGSSGGYARVGGLIDGCDVAASMTVVSGAAAFTAVDFANNLRLVSMTGGRMDLAGCKISVPRGNTLDQFILSSNGTNITIRGGELRLFGGAAAPSSFDYWVNAANKSFFDMRSTRVVDTRTATGIFASGAGRVMLRNLQYDDPAYNCPVLHETRSMLVDGGFEEATIVDDIFVTKEEVAIADRHTVGATVLALDSALVAPHAGSQVLRYEQNNTSGALDSAFALACIAVRPSDLVGGRFYWRRYVTGATTGNITIRYKFVTRGMNSSGIPTILAESEFATATIPDGISDSSWVLAELPDELAAPEWATHFVVEIDGLVWANAGGDYVFFDDLNINIVG